VPAVEGDAQGIGDGRLFGNRAAPVFFGHTEIFVASLSCSQLCDLSPESVKQWTGLFQPTDLRNAALRHPVQVIKERASTVTQNTSRALSSLSFRKHIVSHPDTMNPPTGRRTKKTMVANLVEKITPHPAPMIATQSASMEMTPKYGLHDPKDFISHSVRPKQKCHLMVVVTGH
jgi:hypothetical protein